MAAPAWVRVNQLHVVMRDAVQEEMGSADVTKGTLSNLNAYFVLQQAEKDYKFKVEDVEGLTRADAMTAAGGHPGPPLLYIWQR